MFWYLLISAMVEGLIMQTSGWLNGLCSERKIKLFLESTITKRGFLVKGTKSSGYILNRRKYGFSQMRQMKIESISGPLGLRLLSHYSLLGPVLLKLTAYDILKSDHWALSERAFFVIAITAAFSRGRSKMCMGEVFWSMDNNQKY